MQRGLLVEFSCNPHSLLDSPLESFAGCEIICPWVTSGCYNNLVAFHSCTFTVVELNYDTYDKELFAIFEAFKIWWHYLEGPAYPIDIVMDHKNLEYFSITKVLTWRQVWWSKYLSQFNLVIRFCSGCLSTKLDALTRWWDIYPKGGNTGYATINPYNFKPIFT